MAFTEQAIKKADAYFKYTGGEEKKAIDKVNATYSAPTSCAQAITTIPDIKGWLAYEQGKIDTKEGSGYTEALVFQLTNMLGVYNSYREKNCLSYQAPSLPAGIVPVSHDDDDTEVNTGTELVTPVLPTEAKLTTAEKALIGAGAFLLIGTIIFFVKK